MIIKLFLSVFVDHCVQQVNHMYSFSREEVIARMSCACTEHTLASCNWCMYSHGLHSLNIEPGQNKTPQKTFAFKCIYLKPVIFSFDKINKI